MLKDIIRQRMEKKALGRPDFSRMKRGVNEEAAATAARGKKRYTTLPAPEVPDDCYRKCNFCGKPLLNADVRANFYRCPKCGGQFRVHAYRRAEMIADAGSFAEMNREMPFVNPLGFAGYETKVAVQRGKYGLDEAVITGSCTIEGMPAVLAVCDSRFIMSSMGYNVGEKITRAVEYATEHALPLIIYCCSGGARMQEGIVSLMQMAKTSAALKRHHDAGLLYISVLTNPTTGGVTASFAMLGDVIIAEPEALIGFAGPRVIEQTIGQKLPEGFQRSEFLLAHGFVDIIAERPEQKALIARLLRAERGAKGNTRGAMCEVMPDKEDSGDMTQTAGEDAPDKGRSIQSDSDASAQADSAAEHAAEKTLPELSAQTASHAERETVCAAEIPLKTEKPARRTAQPVSAWERVKRSRRAERPKALDYISRLFDEFTELHGDRAFGDDAAIVGGIAFFGDLPVTVIAEQKGKSVKENLKRNFGMPSPEGYRKAQRLMREAERAGRPVICFVDTPGAYPGMSSEERGQGEAIARCLYELSGLHVPVLSIVLSEGGSGGALALAVANEVWMLENATYSILSPEGFASILYKDAGKAKDAAEVMKITAEDLLRLGVIEAIIPEEQEASEAALPAICAELRARLAAFFARECALSADEIYAERQRKFRNL